MPIPRSSQMQSRFAFSLGSTLFVIFIYLAVGRTGTAYAAEDGSFRQTVPELTVYSEQEIVESPSMNPNLISSDPNCNRCSIANAKELQKRAPDGVSALYNNAPQNKNIDPGQVENWVFTIEEIQGPHGDKGTGFPSDSSVTGGMSDDGPFKRRTRKRQSSSSIWITINTCLQPSSNASSPIPPQLQLYYSTSNQTSSPGPTTGGTQVHVEGGFGIIELNVTTDVWVGVSAPIGNAFIGSWNYEIAASNDAPYHFWSNATDLMFVDGDNHAALLITPDFTEANSSTREYQDWMAMRAPYGVFAHDKRNRSILGVSRSYCGLFNNAKVKANIMDVGNDNVATMTNRGLGGAPKEQFYLGDLSTNASYWGFLAMSGNSTAKGNGVVGGGGRVWTNMTFNTKSSDNCALMYNLTFCSEVAYAVPSNPQKYNPLTGLPELAAVYDQYAQQMYQYFNYSLQQIPCNTTASSQYSLARNCDDCARAYKQWLCAVSIPRCEDWSNAAAYLQPRNMAQNFHNGSVPEWVTDPSSSQNPLVNVVQTNQSRNSAIIDDVIQPGPYKEVLPCIDLCYNLVQSCPAALGFGCPQGKYQNMSYGVRDPDPGVLSCSYLGAAYYLSGGPVTVTSMDKAGWLSLIVTILVLVF